MYSTIYRILCQHIAKIYICIFIYIYIYIQSILRTHKLRYLLDLLSLNIFKLSENWQQVLLVAASLSSAVFFFPFSSSLSPSSSSFQLSTGLNRTFDYFSLISANFWCQFLACHNFSSPFLSACLYLPLSVSSLSFSLSSLPSLLSTLYLPPFLPLSLSVYLSVITFATLLKHYCSFGKLWLQNSNWFEVYTMN